MFPNERFIQTLVFDLKPVHRLPAVAILTCTWLSLFVCIGLALALTYGFATMWDRISESLPSSASVAGSSLTAMLASIAAFQLSLPDRNPRWALLPLPALILWISTSTIGCLEPYTAAKAFAVGGIDNCLMFILAAATPLSILSTFLLRSSYPLRPTLASAIFGVAAAAAAATLLNFAHVKAVSTPDMMIHAIAILLVVSMNVAMVSALTTMRRNASKRLHELDSSASFSRNPYSLQALKEHDERDAAGSRLCANVAIRANDQGNVVRLDRQSPHGLGWNRPDQA